MEVDGQKLIVDWLRARRPHAEIDDDLDLIEGRVIDSLHFVEFLYLLQEITGREVGMEGMSLDRFRTLRAIRTNFLDNNPVLGGGQEQLEELVL